MNRCHLFLRNLGTLQVRQLLLRLVYAVISTMTQNVDISDENRRRSGDQVRLSPQKWSQLQKQHSIFVDFCSEF